MPRLKMLEHGSFFVNISTSCARATFYSTFLSLLFSLLCFPVVRLQDIQDCSRANFGYDIKKEGHRLETAVYKYINVLFPMDCAAQCFREFCCRSANFRKITINDDRENCELLHALADEEPEKLKRNDTYDYLVVGRENPFNCICSPCKNGGNCDGISKKCSCSPGYSGTQCENDIDECLFNPCGTNAECENFLGSYNCTCKKGFIGDGTSCTQAKNCGELHNTGITENGVYLIHLDGHGSFNASCDMTTDGGGWTVFQKRLDGSVDFYRNWIDYKNGFGNMSGEFWLGLDKINRLTRNKDMELRVDLEDFEGGKKFAKYSTFVVEDEDENYKLTVGGYTGDAGDSLVARQNRMKFSTKDRDNDLYSSSCAQTFKGAWWYNGCHHSNLNGLYLRGQHTSFADGVNWYHWRGHYYSLQKTEMKIRPTKS